MDKLNDLLKEYSQDISVEDLDSLKVLRDFIKWLVDNDKIDFIRLDDDSNWYDINTESEYLDILALLSIQDNPIEFLCEILK